MHDWEEALIVVAEELDQEGLSLLDGSHYPYSYDPYLWSDRRKLLRCLASSTALIIRNRIVVDQELVEAAPELRVIGRLGTGLENVDRELLETRNIRLIYAPALNARAVTEYVLAALFHFSRNLVRATQGGDRMELGGTELQGKTLGLIGLGEIGLRVAFCARALGMHVMAYDPYRSPWEAMVEIIGVELLPLEEVISQASFVSLHVPLTPETKGMVNSSFLKQMPRGSYLINTSRGALVDHLALVEALETGHLAGVILDVTDPEPLPEDHPLRRFPNCVITPHIAGLTREAQARISRKVIQGVLEVLGAQKT